MSRRTNLQAKLEEILGSSHVYFQPPSSLLMQYPAIKYDLDAMDIKYADDAKYLRFDRYTITLMDYNPESQYVEALLELPFCRFNRKYKADQLCHYVFDCYVTK